MVGVPLVENKSGQTTPKHEPIVDRYDVIVTIAFAKVASI